jgi:RNA polymerase sigma-70 factor (ECF subfamily)
MQRSLSMPVEATGAGESGDTTLVRAAQEDARAFGRLYERYLPRVYRYLRVRTPTAEDADDLVQQVFLRAYAALPRYQERGAPFAAWLFRIARNVASDAGRRRRDHVAWDGLPDVPCDADGDDPESQVLRRETAGQIRTLLARLDPGKRELLALRFAAGLSSREIGAVTGKSEAAIKKLLTRLLHQLREHYDER